MTLGSRCRCAALWRPQRKTKTSASVSRSEVSKIHADAAVVLSDSEVNFVSLEAERPMPEVQGRRHVSTLDEFWPEYTKCVRCLAAHWRAMLRLAPMEEVSSLVGCSAAPRPSQSSVPPFPEALCGLSSGTRETNPMHPGSFYHVWKVARASTRGAVFSRWQKSQRQRRDVHAGRQTN